MFEKLLSGLGKSLEKHGLPYMIIGGQAVLLYGEPRLTRDIDITLGADTDRLDDLLAVVRDLDLKPLPKEIRSFVRETMVLPALEEKTGIRVDFIFSFTPYESKAISRARRVVVMDQEVYFASPEDLIIHKIFAGRPRDMEDVRSVLLKNPGVDLQYIKSRLRDFDQASENQEFLKAFERILVTPEKD
jgi:hypothetical protein